MARTLRFKFTREQQLKYISHLDILRVFERTLRRANIPVEYTQGFNPRQKLVFGLPLSIGLTSEAEYADIVLTNDLSCEEFVLTLNKYMPEGIKLLGAVELTKRENIMNQIKAARYSILLDTDNSKKEIEDLVTSMLSNDELLVMKKTKKGVRPVNIRPMIFSLLVNDKVNGNIELEAFLSAGSANNLRADLLMKAFMEQTGLKACIVSIHRKALYALASNQWKDPFEVANG